MNRVKYPTTHDKTRQLQFDKTGEVILVDDRVKYSTINEMNDKYLKQGGFSNGTRKTAKKDEK